MKQMQIKNVKKSNVKLRKVVAIQVSRRKEQEGAALIAVLLFLILISLAGVMAVKQSSTDLKLATSDQINTLLLQSSDAGNQQLEDVVNGDVSNSVYDDVFSDVGLFGHYILGEETDDNEYTYCFNNSTDKYLKVHATVRNEAGLVGGMNGGNCNPATKADYASSRKIVMTQMDVIPTEVFEAPSKEQLFKDYLDAKDTESKTSKLYTFNIRSTSTLPAYADSDITSCFGNTSVKGYVTGTGKTVEECLKAANSPTQTLFEEVELSNVTIVTMCKDYGDDPFAEKRYAALCKKAEAEAEAEGG